MVVLITVASLPIVKILLMDVKDVLFRRNQILQRFKNDNYYVNFF